MSTTAEFNIIKESMSASYPCSKHDVYLNPKRTYPDREQLRALGAIYNRDKKQWYVPAGMNLATFSKWLLENDLAYLRVAEAPAQPAQPEEPAQPAQPAQPEQVSYVYESAPTPAAHPAARFCRRDFYIKNKYDENCHVKALGARYNPKVKCWYIPAGKNILPFVQWMNSSSVKELKLPYAVKPVHLEERLYLHDVKTDDQNYVKACGAEYDKKRCEWYIPPHTNIVPFRRYIEVEKILFTQQEPENPAEFKATFGKPLRFNERVYLRVQDWDIIKIERLGAEWDGERWYIPAGMLVNPFWQHVQESSGHCCPPEILNYDITKISSDESASYVACDNPMYFDPIILNRVITNLGSEKEIIKICRALKDTQHFESIKSWVLTYRRDLLTEIFCTKLLAREDMIVRDYEYELIEYGLKFHPTSLNWFIMKGTPLEPFMKKRSWNRRDEEKYCNAKYFLSENEINEFHERQKQELAKIGIQI